MNGPTVRMLTDAAVFRGELGRMLLAAGIVLLIIFIAWAIQEFEMRKTACALGWLGMSCLAVMGMGAVFLIAVGLL